VYALPSDAGGFFCIVAQRSKQTGMFQEKYDVMPTGGFERCHPEVPANKEWSIKLSIYRELLEEVYNDESMKALSSPWLDYVYSKPQIRIIEEALTASGHKKGALLSVTGISFDLTTLIPEISAVLVVWDKRIRDFIPSYNWEWLNENSDKRIGNGRIPLKCIPKFLEQATVDNLVPSAAVALRLGYEFLEKAEDQWPGFG